MNSGNDSDTLDANNYAGAYIDVLGQSELLRKFPRLPDITNEATRIAFFANVRETVGTTSGIAKLFENYFIGATRAERTRFVPAQFQTHVNRLTRKEVNCERFSDGFFFYSPIATKVTAIPVMSVYALLSACALVYLACLAAGSPIRGGVDIGWGLKVDNQLYGSVVYNAYRLESRVADYPRIVVGPNLLGYLKSLLPPKIHTLETEIAAGLAQTCLGGLFRDDDGSFAIDCLGDWTIRVCCDEIGNTVVKMIRDAYRFVLQQRTAYQNSQNIKLERRYAKLQSYFESRAKTWPQSIVLG